MTLSNLDLRKKMEEAYNRFSLTLNGEREGYLNALLDLKCILNDESIEVSRNAFTETLDEFEQENEDGQECKHK